MRTILIPTDFTSVPLLLLKHAATRSRDKIDVVFMYSTFLSNSITELLFSTPAKAIQKAMNNEFKEGCAIIVNRYPGQISGIRYEVLYGNNVRAFEVLAQANKIDVAVLPCELPFANKGQMFDPTRLILNSRIAVHKIDLQLAECVAESDLIATLLTS